MIALGILVLGVGTFLFLGFEHRPKNVVDRIEL